MRDVFGQRMLGADTTSIDAGGFSSLGECVVA
jgi:hypothetical protein